MNKGDKIIECNASEYLDVLAERRRQRQAPAQVLVLGPARYRVRFIESTRRPMPKAREEAL